MSGWAAGGMWALGASGSWSISSSTELTEGYRYVVSRAVSLREILRLHMVPWGVGAEEPGVTGERKTLLVL